LSSGAEASSEKAVNGRSGGAVYSFSGINW
jgi:hypothetical protein